MADQRDFRRMSHQELARHVASLYDQKKDYKAEYAELVRRVGQDEAERLVDQA
jgi:hypothetical protein